MSRAFVKESDSPHADEFERPQSEHPNYVTPSGLERLRAQVRALEEKRAALERGADDPMKQQQVGEIERDLRYVQGRVERAVPVDLSKQPADEVHFGAVVEVEDQDGRHQVFSIVGEDEVDAATGRVSWVSPLAAAMLGARVGDSVTWQRPAGNLELEITSIRYPPG
jgi:transcription elongation factor GreB